MTVHEWYVDSSVPSEGDGTKTFPFKTLAHAGEKASRNGGDVNHVHLKADSVFYEPVPQVLSSGGYVGCYMDSYGAGALPIIDVTTDCTNVLEYDAEHDWYTAILGTHEPSDQPDKLTIGAIFEDGVPLPFQLYTDDYAKLRESLEGGGYSYDWRDGRAFVVASEEVQSSLFKGKPDKPPGKPPKPSEPQDRSYRVATRSNVMSCAAPGPFGATDSRLNQHYKGIMFIGAKRIAVEFATSKGLFEGCILFGHGGQRFGDAPENYLGNGIELCVHADDIVIRRCGFSQIFDSAVTAQAYGNGQYVTNVTIEDNDFDCCGLAAVELSIQAGNDARVEHIEVLGNRIKSNHGCFAPDIYGGRYAGITVIFNVKTGTLDHIKVLNNDIEDMIHNAFTITECGEDVHVDFNNVRRCETGVFFGPNAGNPTHVVGVFNTFEDCKTVFRINGSNAAARAVFKNSVMQGGEVAFSDGSPGNVQIELIDNTMNATIAIDSARTEGITGFGNTSIGEIDPKFRYLFDE